MSRLALCWGSTLLESMSPGAETGTWNAAVSSSKVLLKVSRHTKSPAGFIYLYGDVCSTGNDRTKGSERGFMQLKTTIPRYV